MLGRFQTIINIDDDKFPININVVSDNMMQYELLIGTDFLNNVVLTIKEGKISITKAENVTREPDNVPEILSIVYNCEVNKVDLSYVVNKEHRHEIEKIVSAYCLTKTRSRHTNDYCS